MPRRTSGQRSWPQGKRVFNFSPARVGHSSPHPCPTQYPHPGDADPLGTPLSIGGVAALIGCSVWTVRQKYLPLGLPHWRLGDKGKLTFYRTQVIRWLVLQQATTNS
jgi:hypothetical protein